MRKKVINKISFKKFILLEKIKDDLIENQDFIKDILKGISSTDLNDDELKDVINQIKNENKDNDQNKNDEEKK